MVQLREVIYKTLYPLILDNSPVFTGSPYLPISTKFVTNSRQILKQNYLSYLETDSQKISNSDQDFDFYLMFAKYLSPVLANLTVFSASILLPFGTILD